MLKRSSADKTLFIWIVSALLSGVSFAGCKANESVLRSAPSPVPQASLEPRKTDLETDIKEIETAGIEHVFIVRRKDKAVFDKDDRQFLRDNLTTEINRRVSSDGGKAFILATNFLVPPEVITNLKQRFDVEERSTTSRSESDPKNQKK